MKKLQGLDERMSVCLILEGCELSEKTAKELERHLQSSPDDIVTRTKLLAYCIRTTACLRLG